jgi:hypothetical protein
MNKQELRELKARAQRLEALINDFENDVALLHQNGVDVSNNTEISEQQTQIQEELELITSDLLAVLSVSGTASVGDININLPNTGRTPISGGSLPEPRVDIPESRGTPLWVEGSDSNGSNDSSGGSD